jgi:hypothetical protein
MSYFSGTNSVYSEPRVATYLPIGSRFQLKGAYGRFHQFIRKLRSQDLFLNSPDYWRMSDMSEIPVLRSDQFLAGLKYDDGLWVVDIEAYYRGLSGVVEDPIDVRRYHPELTGGLLTGSGRAKGIDILLQRSLGKHTGWFSASLGEVRYEFKNLEQSRVPASHDQLFEMKAVYLYRLPYIKLSAAFVYGSGRPYTPLLGTYSLQLVNGDTREFPVFGEVNSGRLPEYHRLDIAATYTRSISDVILEGGISVYNIYGRQNVKDIQYFVSSTEGADQSLFVGQRTINMLGMIPTFKLNLSF